MNTETNTPANQLIPPSVRKPILPIPNAEEKLREIAEKQGTLGKSTFETVFGSGADLWESDEEFERFLEFIRESRRR